MRKKTISIIGSAEPGAESYKMAVKLGKELVDAGYRVATGGLQGIMKAAMEGAHQSKNYQEGDTIGIIPGTDINDANEFVDIVIPTGLGYARNLILVQTGAAVIAIEGSWGTLSEISLAAQQAKPIILMSGTGGWVQYLSEREEMLTRNIYVAENVREALEIINRLI
ncbi:MAG: TIGR00725 family protein [Candidatus Cloacimonetes bacterium]|nr:TIGR00725 family protein [Candidatus Cloacimonadota bacterium]